MRKSIRKIIIRIDKKLEFIWSKWMGLPAFLSFVLILGMGIGTFIFQIHYSYLWMGIIGEPEGTGKAMSDLVPIVVSAMLVSVLCMKSFKNEFDAG